VGAGLVIATTAGFILGRLKLEKWVEPFVFETRLGGQVIDSTFGLTWDDRIQMGIEEVLTILRNTFYSSRRKTRREVSDTDGIHAGRQATKPDHDGKLAMRDFRAAFPHLPVEQREGLILVGASGFSYEDAAETCGVAVGTIKSRVHRGRIRLTELLGLKDDDNMEMTDKATMAVVNGMIPPGRFSA
jgi:RNA polymerase sigma-70 factor (ECF subfamily)